MIYSVDCRQRVSGRTPYDDKTTSINMQNWRLNRTAKDLSIHMCTRRIRLGILSLSMGENMASPSAAVTLKNQDIQSTPFQPQKLGPLVLVGS
ncbi:activating signal cointegrator 1 complex subunit 3 [Histoplasma capsulatum G186AR]|uniref:Activating signal cointegrator 1 complex subunit 3 n=1 Tax=Ajellomyces capsulatus TaxID=5037 RepID=A0A8H7YQP2_AJECA|nr:activating signal cointegrator 1 complex subunit 3 [Histoplasma capsulatum]QSS73895.1 activating signal cointegrator 1 complex subunit 3 [Histoplasma capsulatum G186AR]